MGSVVSVNVGRAAPLRAGRQRSSAIVKRPVAGPVAARGHQLAGDEQADRVHHGGPSKAALAYALEDTAWWEGELGRALGPATWGENLTLSGIDVTGARIGERWSIGNVVLAVTGPRVPCQKLATRMSEPRFVRRFTQAGRPGAYLAIVTEGELRAGDGVEIVHRPGHDVTVGLVFEAMLRDRSRLGELDAARADMTPALAEWIDAVRPSG